MSEIFLGFSNKPIDLEFLNETLSKVSSRLGLKKAVALKPQKIGETHLYKKLQGEKL